MIAAADFIPDEYMQATYKLLLGLTEDEIPEPFGDDTKFAEVGFETTWSLYNFGSLAIFLSFFPILVVTDLILRLLRKRSKKARIIQQKISSSIYWNASIRVVIESYVILLLSALINAVTTSEMRWDKPGTKFITINTIFFLVLCMSFPFVATAFLYFNFHKTKDQKFFDTYGALYEGFRLNDIHEKGEDTPPTKKGIIWYQFYFLFRRLILAVLVVLSKDVLFWQIAGLVYQTVFACIIVGQVRPFETNFQNTMEFFNEMMIMFVMYIMMTFTDWMPD